MHVIQVVGYYVTKTVFILLLMFPNLMKTFKTLTK